MRVKWEMCVGRKTGFVPIYKPATQDVLVTQFPKKRRQNRRFLKNHVMQRFVIAMTILLTSANWCSADHRKQVIVANQFAVPVGVPVSPYSSYAYSSSQHQQQAYSAPPKSAEDILLEKLATLVAAKIEAKGGTVKALEKPTVFSQSCVACHKKNADTAPQFTSLLALSDDQLDACFDAVLNDRMPKGGHLPPEKAGALLKEFNGERMVRKKNQTVKALDVPPPPPPLPEELQ